ncbi:hypothetical protein ACE1MS_21070 [Lysinibacillus sp. fkY74-1]|uniref:Uncharacterized protein n=3 Tax=Lysinibacillus TaxID=400634 RepID=B1HZN1_LYSSC|nr:MULTISPECIES: hypothetical protein [Lysinibacillus]MBE5085531.1 hypothetical protein [Bacillus thuringiensis]ACA41890.1 conserved hypothetical protein [Lysinibacillus sphaericus C3-41]AMO31823.1 hypothetical protein AR327_04655 [Lysinibacillus sphaericus]AMR89059.1 hypothetical protein A1T07_02015 [Lysinibacillus sphaericus]ANA47130.1 hypothetical protein A2J09_17225 [Lysinibacillus sphaericus]
MQEHMPSQAQELICINVDKVYDWIVKEMSFDISPTGAITFPGVTAATDLTGAIVTCRVIPAATNPIVILNRENRQFSIDGSTVCLQHLNIQKNFILTIVVTLPNGTMFTSAEIPVSRCEQVTLCAPKGTDVEILYTDLDCFVCTTGTLTAAAGAITFSALTITVAVCQSIQSTFPVTVEFLATFCEPRADLPFTCPTAVRPQQCPVIFPTVG